MKIAIFESSNAPRHRTALSAPKREMRLVVACLLVTALLATVAAAQNAPVNYRQNGEGQDIGGGVLVFRYTWASSNGKLDDLGDCQVGEDVKYPGNNNPYVWTSPPYKARQGTPNPTVKWLPATWGKLRDQHTHKDFLQPYQADNFTATQDYRSRCTNVNNNNPTNFANLAGIQIVRTVTNPQANCWVYTVTKSGAQAEQKPMPNSGPCGRGGKMQIAPTGETQSSGSGAGFSLARATTTLHEPVIATFSVFNSSSETVNFDLGKDMTSSFIVAVTDPNGNSTTRQLDPDGVGLDGSISLPAGEGFSSDLLLNRWNDFSSVGDYRIRITLNGSITSQNGGVLAAQPSQVLYLHVGPRDAQKLGATASAQADAAINASAIEERMTAAETLSYIKDPLAVPQLIRVLNQGTFVEHFAVQGLGWIANPQAIVALWEATAHPDSDIRALAVFTLNTLGQQGFGATD